MYRGDCVENLRNLRKNQNITQLDLQMRTGIDQSLLSKYENSERMPTIENLIILAGYFGTSTDYLMGLTDQKSPHPRKG